jgi:beta-lactamase class A
MKLDLPDAGGVSWSVCIRDDGGMPLGSVAADLALRTASVGKVLLLLEAARAMSVGELGAREPLTRTDADRVADSGLWHTLAVDTLPATDVAALVGAVSDNLATNVLLRRVGLDAVAGTAAYLGLEETALHDRVRDERGPRHAATLSTGTAAELSDLAHRIMHESALGPAADSLVRQWLSANTDQSLVGSAFVAHAGLDPLAHHVSLSPDLLYWNKTGSDRGVRADIGSVSRDGSTISWAAIANWDASEEPSATERMRPWSVLRGMHLIGEQVLDSLP